MTAGESGAAVAREVSAVVYLTHQQPRPTTAAWVFVLAGALAVSTVVAAGAAENLGAPETWSGHFSSCHATCVRKQSEDASGES